MPVSVRQILELDVLKHAHLLAGGEAALERKVTSVTVGEVPDIAEWLSGGEMVLTTLYAVKGDLERQKEFCETVMMADAAALFIKTTRFVEKLPDEVIGLANKRKFPIVVVPQDLRWTRLMQDATELIINRHASLLERARSIHRGLVGVVIKGGTWQELINEVTRLLERRVVVLDSSLEVLGSSKDLPISIADLRAYLDRPGMRESFIHMGEAEKLFRFRGEGLPSIFALPIVASHSRLGYVCIFTEAEDLPNNDVLVLENAATIAALQMAQDRVRFETEVRLKGDFVDDVVNGEGRDGDSLVRRGAFLGCDLSQGATVLLLGVDEFDGLLTRRDKGPEDLDRRVERFFSRCSQHISSAEPLSLTSLKSGRVVVFVCGDSARDANALKKLAGALQNLGKTVAELSVSVGIGGFTPLAGHMARGYQEALVALNVGRKLQGPGSLLSFEDVGTYRLLLDIWERDPEAIRTLYEDTIGPVDRYDKAGNTHLVETLVVFFRNNENLTQTALDLFAHRHTIRYRLEKIAEISGLSVFQTEHKERLGLGLKARSLLLS
jgi:purine catabolism regulator